MATAPSSRPKNATCHRQSQITEGVESSSFWIWVMLTSLLQRKLRGNNQDPICSSHPYKTISPAQASYQRSNSHRVVRNVLFGVLKLEHPKTSKNRKFWAGTCSIQQRWGNGPRCRQTHPWAPRERRWINPPQRELWAPTPYTPTPWWRA